MAWRAAVSGLALAANSLAAGKNVLAM